ncbi:MAG TPA: response regulator [Terriglobales bacterium]|nr:response regulator [Terriglobales bacterium]
MKYRVLLVDDEPAILFSVSMMLEGDDLEVHTATSVETARQKLVTESYDLVLTDLKMETPAAGYDVVEVANQQDYKPATAVMSAYSALSSDWADHGADAVFEKPTNPPELLRAIKKLLEARERKLMRA